MGNPLQRVYVCKTYAEDILQENFHTVLLFLQEIGLRKPENRSMNFDAAARHYGGRNYFFDDKA